MKEKEVKKWLIESNLFSPSIWNIFQNYRYEILQEYINNTKHQDFIRETGSELQKVIPYLLFGDFPKDMEGFPKISEPYTYEKYMNNFQPLFDEERKFSSVLLRAFAENSEELLLYNNLKLKLTEKEVNTILYLSKKNNPVKINELEKNVWQYQSNIETHTVETHIYRLRKKISQKFKDDNFIVSKKNGYQIV